MILNKCYEYSDSPIPNWEFPQLLDDITTSNLKCELEELYELRKKEFKVFDRNGSMMYEWTKYNRLITPFAFDLISEFHSSEFVRFLEKISGINGLIPDIHLHGAGYMRCGRGDSLKIHTDFNWNDTIKLNRELTVMVYLNKDWKEDWNGDIQLWDKKNTHCVKRYFPKWGNCVIWKHDELGFHGHPNPITAPDGEFRDGFRFFYYTSNSTNDNPHRSLYWFDGINPIDKND